MYTLLITFDDYDKPPERDFEEFYTLKEAKDRKKELEDEQKNASYHYRLECEITGYTEEDIAEILKENK